MPNRMSPAHGASGLDGTHATISLAPVSRNGDTTNVVNGATIDLHGKGGVIFVTAEGALTGSANVAYHLQTNNNHLDPGNGTWTNVSGATLAAATDPNVSRQLAYSPAAGDSPIVRIVQTVDANVSVSGVVHVTF